MTIAIDKGVPIPLRTHGNGKTRIYPFSELEVGDSFIMGEYSRKLVQQAGSSCAHYGKKLGAKFSVRRCGDVLRVWRTA